jgi:hypothetical protein
VIARGDARSASSEPDDAVTGQGGERRSRTCVVDGEETPMIWGVLGGILYFVLLFTLGLWTLRKGHWVMFLVGIIFPLFWLIGAVIPPAAKAT